MRVGETVDGGLTKYGAAVLHLDAVNDYNGPTVVYDQGVIQADDGVGLPTASTLVLDGGWLMNATMTSFSRTIGTGAGQVYFGANGGGFACGGDFTYAGAGNVDLTVSLGDVCLGDAATTGDIGTKLIGTLSLNRGYYTNAARMLTFQSNVELNGSRTVSVPKANANMTGVLSNGTVASSLTKVGDGVLYLTGEHLHAPDHSQRRRLGAQLSHGSRRAAG